MTARCIISTSVILSLLLALMLPVGTHAHGCHGDDAVARPASRVDERHDEHHHDNRGGHDHDADHHGGDHRDGVRGNEDRGNARYDGRHVLPGTVADAPGIAPARHPVFCCTEGRETIVERVDAASLPAPLPLTSVIASAASSGMLPLDVLVGPRIVDDYKIGSSPPQFAAIDRYTYLRISALLV